MKIDKKIVKEIYSIIKTKDIIKIQSLFDGYSDNNLKDRMFNAFLKKYSDKKFNYICCLINSLYFYNEDNNKSEKLEIKHLYYLGKL